MSGRGRKSGGGGPGRKNNKGRKVKKQQTPTSSGRGRGGSSQTKPRRSSLPNERTRGFDPASPTGRSFIREDAYFRKKFLEEQELLANMMRVNQRKRQKSSPSRHPFQQRHERTDSESESDESDGSMDSDVVNDYLMNISSDEDLGALHESLKGLTADENFRILRKYDEDVIDDEEDGESSDEGDETNQIRNQVGKFNLSKKVRKRREKKAKKRQANPVVNRQNNRVVERGDFEDERPSLDAYLGTHKQYYAEEDFYQVPSEVMNPDKLRSKYLKMLSGTQFVRAKDPASMLEPAMDPSVSTTVTLTTTATMTPVNTDTIIQKVETISISTNNNETVKTETVKAVVQEKAEKPDVVMEEFKDKAPVLTEKLPEYRFQQVTEIKIVTSAPSTPQVPQQSAKKNKPQKQTNTNSNKKPSASEEIEFEWVDNESDSEDDSDDIVIDEEIEEDDEEDDEDDLSDIEIADLMGEEDEEDDEDDEDDSESEDEPRVQFVFDNDAGLSKKEKQFMLYWAQEDQHKRQARRANRRPAGSESEDTDLSEEEFLEMQDMDDDSESSEEDEKFTRVLNAKFSPQNQRQFTPSPKGRRMPRDSVGFPSDDDQSPSHKQEKPMSAKQRKLARNKQPGVKVSKKKIKKLNRLYKDGNKKRRLTRSDIEYWSQIFVEFIQDETMDVKSVNNMNKFQLMQLAKQAKFYNMKASMAGSGKRRYTVVHKTDHTRLRSEEDTKKFLNRFFPEEEEITRRNGEMRYGRNNGPKTKVNTDKTMHMRVLVGNSQPIPESNLGHIMLMRMGWIGGGLGSQKQGIEEPIQPVIRPRGRGLGFNTNSL